MATKTIIIETITLAVHDDAKSTPFKFDREGRTITGFLHVDHVLPGKPATLDAAEADYILLRHGGREIHPETGETLQVVAADIQASQKLRGVA